ncbi:isochorismatase family cysteine hydrolase [[Pseudomonas] boreopolis]|uniref:isochorismatase family cysteine hydrolase n=1 Tax=Xanthomonas boreopolis TaxID=86183 RepID=UPI003D9B97FE
MSPPRAPSRPALLVIDMIGRFDFPEAEAMAASVRKATQAIAALLEVCRRRQVPVIFANDNFAQWKVDFRGLIASARESGGLGLEVADRLHPTEDDYYVLKPKHSAFLATPLPVLLAKLQVGMLYLSGMTADSCVLATALDGNAREYRVRVIRQAVAGLSGPLRQAMELMQLSPAVDVVDMQDAMRAFERNRR